jgi:UPF0148 protein
MSDEEKKKLKLMSEALRTGATMLPDLCPSCGLPLFKVKGEIWCLNENRQVITVKEGEEAPVPESPADTALLSNVEQTALSRLREINQQAKDEKNPEKLQQLGSLISTWLEVLERLKRIRRTSAQA